MNKLDKKLFEFIKKHNNVNITSQAIRNEISKIRAKYPSITMNAAASLFAKKKAVKVMRFLNQEDRNSLQNIQNNHSTILETTPKKNVTKIKKVTISPSFGGNVVQEANDNAEVYPYVYILENSLRNLILDTFKSVSNWWNTKATTNAKNHAEWIKNAEKKHDWLPKRGKHPIYYIGLDDLFGIISKNYNTNFKHIFTDLGNLRTWINECVPIRNLLAHNIKVKKEERDNLKIRTKYICTLIEKNSSKSP